MKFFKGKKYKIIIQVFLCILLISCDLRSNRPLPFDKSKWNFWDITFDENRYNMAIWFFKENWFNGKTKDNIINELRENEKNLKKMNYIWLYYGNESEENILLFDLRYSNEFMERWDIDYQPKPTAYLRTYFDENDKLIRAELLEGKRSLKVEDYKIKKYWEIN